ncbi:RNA-directed DNA polymerase (Reverse transcriptase), partial [Trifolium medium]|nr:RNA-directed DNA polymerase (Reverse transcriptase) [Trifolium medium]
KQLKVIIVDDEEEGDQEGRLLAVEVEEEDEEAQGEVSLMEFQQFQQLNHGDRSRPQVIKLRGTIHEVPVVILVDSGASHNFISQHLVHKMNWSVVDSPPMNIKLGDGSCAKTKGICEGLVIDMDGLKIVADVQLFDLGCVDVVLGVEWLRTLGDMIVNWQKQSMSFWFNKQWVTLRGMENHLGVMETLHSVLCKPLWSGLEGWEGRKKKVNGEVLQTLEEGQSRSLEHLLNLCADVFQEPKGLPPKRTKEHVINLKEGEGAVNVRPYRYPHHHKNEIERQVKEMLESGIIRHSTSSFSSPVILVKKKDSSWRMCIDYRALNKATIPDKFPIPVIEELLDELNGAKFFSKLDLKSGYHQGVAVDPGKVVSVTKWPIPKNVKGVREAQISFDSLKRSLTTAPVLTLPDFNKDFTIECDASGGGIGAILMQKKKPIAYFSKALGVRNLAKSAYEKELMAVVLAIQHWRPYLIGRKFIVSTDQKSLKQLLQQRMVTADQHNWAAKLLGYDFEIVYKPGKLNRGADALSRVNEDGEMCQAVSSVKWIDERSLKEGIQQDNHLQQVIKKLQENCDSCPGYEYTHGVLLYENRLVLPAKSTMIPLLLSEFHDTPQGGHSGFYRTYRRLASNVYWIGMKNAVQEYVRACDICQRQKYLTSSPGGLLQPLPIPDRIWEDLSMDFVTGLPKSKGYEAILVVVDRLSKYTHFVPLKHPYTARTIAEVFVREVVRLHGIPLSIVSDRDAIFMSNFWRELFKLQGTKLKMSTSYHPETDGQTEVVNRCLETYLRCFICDQPKNWSHWLSWGEYWFNTNYHASTGKSPYEIVYGRVPPVITRWVQGETRVAAVQKELMDRDEALRQLREHLLRAQDRMKQLADKKRCDRSFEVGEWVFVKLRAHRQQSVVCRINAKLAARYYGPYPVVGRVGAVAYQLKLPAGSRVHPVFHVSLLKKAVGTYHEEEDLPELEGEQGVLIEPEEVLARRVVKIQNEDIEQVLIHWKGQGVEEATWEDVIMMKSQFPNLCLEDKALNSGGSVVRTQNIDKESDTSLIQSSVGPREWKVYSRRNKRLKS